MKIGAMNNSSKDLCEQIEFIGEQGFDFLDLTIEPDLAYADNIDAKKINELLKKYNLKVVGHTPWNLPIASTFASVRDAAFVEFKKCLKVFKKLPVKYVNVHPVMSNDVGDPNLVIEYNVEFFKKIVAEAKKYKIKIMMENTKSLFNEIEIIGKILDEIPGLKLHWDVGHANLGNEGEAKTKLVFDKFKKKIAHLHFSDNNGSEDQHLPIGVGNINWPFVMKTLMDEKYNRTITLEIHAPDPSYLLISRDKIKFIIEQLKEENKNTKKK
jgi:sugar phosphate isomerase/epimerase